MGITKFGAEKSFGMVLDLQKFLWKVLSSFKVLVMAASRRFYDGIIPSRRIDIFADQTFADQTFADGHLIIKSPMDSEEGPVEP